jgi:hypothetical protein
MSLRDDLVTLEELESKIPLVGCPIDGCPEWDVYAEHLDDIVRPGLVRAWELLGEVVRQGGLAVVDEGVADEVKRLVQ